MTPLETILSIVATALAAYLTGSIPFGYLIGRLHGVDIRTIGSGNIGATNVTRTIGKWPGRLCFALDFAKGAFPVLVVKTLTQWTDVVTDEAGILPSCAAFFAVCGHIWPIYLKFKGGKGISTAAGAIISLNPMSLTAAGIVWAILFFTSRYVSLASIFAAASLPVFCIVLPKILSYREAPLPEFVLLCLLAFLTIIKHASNIKRLLNGTENRFEKKKK